MSLEEFVRVGCGCQLGTNKAPCSQSFTMSDIEKNRQDSTDLVRSELDLVILSQCCVNQTTHCPSYFMHGKLICLQTFLYFHNISHARYYNLVHHYEQNGLCPRLPYIAFSLEDTTHAITFIENYARAHGLPLPGRVPGHRDKVMALPSDATKTVVFSVYKEACSKSSRNAVGRSKLWQLNVATYLRM